MSQSSLLITNACMSLSESHWERKPLILDDVDVSELEKSKLGDAVDMIIKPELSIHVGF